MNKIKNTLNITLLSAILGMAGAAQAEVKPELAAKVPESIKAAGVLTVGSQQTFPPVEYRRDGEDMPVGVSASLLAEITERLGLALEYRQADYSALIPGLEAKRFDMASGGISDTEEREQKVDFVNYMMSGASILLRQEDDGKYKTIMDFCDDSISTMLGGRTIMTAVEAASADCVAAGKGEITAEQLPGAPDSRMQLDLKRVNGYIGDFPALVYMISGDPDKYVIADGNYLLVKYVTSWAFPKESPLTPLFQETVQGMLEDGSYLAILEEWGMQGAALPEITINLPASKR
ncbi:transporter substrate-binding domain-containing protein [Alloyangia pacifica]|uniref:Polar amino acid transport system substrate-binding protein n=1 Tax=Alloyangia pacifica TaxID=311180 RepID=A0A1I6QQ50_9RHOB|nr:transporter substrate-binding domain-containing protein [Alloyangia pacifica]SDF95180.1 polar amino acid transport system substrate-binding protein [Alloyangia pacifica]SFS54611.1 polar amino acid transport system substrate-binding protein [Alloyangia pacifica]